MWGFNGRNPMFTQTIDQNPNINILSFPCSVSPLNKEISLDNPAKYKLRGTSEVTLKPTVNREAYI